MKPKPAVWPDKRATVAPFTWGNLSPSLCLLFSALPSSSLNIQTRWRMFSLIYKTSLKSQFSLSYFIRGEANLYSSREPKQRQDSKFYVMVRLNCEFFFLFWQDKKVFLLPHFASFSRASVFLRSVTDGTVTRSYQLMVTWLRLSYIWPLFKTSCFMPRSQQCIVKLMKSRGKTPGGRWRHTMLSDMLSH